MKLGTIRTNDGTRAVRADNNSLTALPWSDVGELLAGDGIDEARSHEGGQFDPTSVTWAPLVPRPDKIVCVGLNYRDHVEEMGRELPPNPTYFSKFRGALIGATDAIQLPAASVSTSIDWEAELCVVIGRRARHVDAANALDHIAGFTVLNDVSVRDWQTRTTQFLAGKTFEGMTPVGPTMVTVDEIGDGTGLAIESRVDGEVKQSSNTRNLIFSPTDLVADLSRIITLEPGDLIATGTPGGVGAGRSPQEWLSAGSEVVTTIEGVGELRNRCVATE
jgi:acylpyruvate hydrolase